MDAILTSCFFKKSKGKTTLSSDVKRKLQMHFAQDYSALISGTSLRHLSFTIYSFKSRQVRTNDAQEF